MPNVLQVERCRPKWKQVFQATKVVERQGKEWTSTQTPCAECGTPGTLLLES